ncbi:LysR family transcriptional regulator [Shewanella woodyi]|uniref:LysR family transcriptional regulator n=1 Tax=Shewanella woodyi TaxID=60961 RepID=UPI0007F86962|nr:LysR family transcriptional regulator [Shewanella woodyi]
MEQWKVFVAIVEHGGSVQAADKMYKSQSAISHSLKKMESTLKHSLFTVEGRKLTLTPLGKLLLPKAKSLLGQATQMEVLSNQYRDGMLNEIAIAVDVLVPIDLLQDALDRLAQCHPGLNIRVFETALSGTKQYLEEGEVQFGIASTLPTGHNLEPFISVPLVCVSHIDHPLQQMGKINYETLKQYFQVVIRDSGKQALDTGWLGAPKRWTVTNISTSLHLVLEGKCFAWLPEHSVSQYIKEGKLAPVPLVHGKKRGVFLQMAVSGKYSLFKEVQDMVSIFRDVGAKYQLEQELSEELGSSEQAVTNELIGVVE